MSLRNRKGVAILFMAMLLVIFLLVCAFVADVGFFYYRRAEAQKAADAAALAGASKLPDSSAAAAAAQAYATSNGYTNGVEGTSVTAGIWNTDPPAEISPHPNWYKVTISKPERYFFGTVLGFLSKPIGAYATAEYTARQPIDIWGGFTYGTTGTQSLEISGPYGRHDYGDAYSTKYLDGEGTTANPSYDPTGYNFWLNVPSNYNSRTGTNTVKLELYDACSGSSQDEVYTSHGVSTQATTVYSLYAPDNTPNDYSDDVLIATVTVPPNSSTYKLKWATPSGFSFNSATYGTGNYRVNVKTTSGSGGNAFHMRAGPPTSTFKSDSAENGTVITSVGKMEMYFLHDGTVNWQLGYIPTEAAGLICHIKKFDTDIGASSITYTDGGSINQTGTLSTNDAWCEDVFTIPKPYGGGYLSAIYSAGQSDTSVWEMWYEGVIAGEPGHVKLVQ